MSLIAKKDSICGEKGIKLRINQD